MSIATSIRWSFAAAIAATVCYVSVGCERSALPPEDEVIALRKVGISPADRQREVLEAYRSAVLNGQPNLVLGVRGRVAIPRLEDVVAEMRKRGHQEIPISAAREGDVLDGRMMFTLYDLAVPPVDPGSEK